jgi:hypothetical protein
MLDSTRLARQGTAARSRQYVMHDRLIRYSKTFVRYSCLRAIDVRIVRYSEHTGTVHS